MTTSNPVDRSVPPPNHHAHYPGFAGVGGLLAAMTFTVGRAADADLAIRLTGTGPGDHVVDVGCGPGRGGPACRHIGCFGRRHRPRARDAARGPPVDAHSPFVGSALPGGHR